MNKDEVIKLIDKVKIQQRKDMLDSDLLEGKMWTNKQVVNSFDKYADWLIKLVHQGDKR